MIKKLGYIFTLLSTALTWLSMYLTNTINPTNLENSSVGISIILLLTIVSSFTAIGGLLHKSWAKKVSLIAVGITVVYIVLAGNPIPAVAFAISFGLILLS